MTTCDECGRIVKISNEDVLDTVWIETTRKYDGVIKERFYAQATRKSPKIGAPRKPPVPRHAKDAKTSESKSGVEPIM